jgi:hypothetical protein
MLDQFTRAAVKLDAPAASGLGADPDDAVRESAT